MRYLNLLALSLASVMSFVSVAEQINCKTISADLNKIVKLKESGKFRQLAANQPSANFSYSAKHTFQDYLVFAKKQVTVRNPKAAMPCPIETGVTIAQQKGINSIIVADLVTPFELKAKDNKKGILLIHGLTDSPYLFHDLATFFYQQGFNVRTLLLPGHGTAAEALLDVHYKEWQQATKFAIDKTVNDFEQVYLGGFSTGGALILDDLLTTQMGSRDIKGVMLWAPASKAKSSAAGLAKVVDWIPFLDYAHKAADVDFAKYESFPLNAGAQVHSLMKGVSKKLEKTSKVPPVPLFIVTSEFDSTIDTAATVNLLSDWHDKKEESRDDTLFYFGSDSSLSVLPSSVIRVFGSCEGHDYCNNIVNVAHTSVTNSPNNAHYGWQGSYRNCESVSTDVDYAECKTTQQVKLGETTTTNLEKHHSLQRLTFNPDYQKMLTQLRLFIDKTN